MKELIICIRITHCFKQVKYANCLVFSLTFLPMQILMHFVAYQTSTAVDLISI